MKRKKKNKDANTFKETIPSILYKFFALNDNKERNNDKILSLKKNEIWVSTYKEQNDPFEFINLNLKLSDNEKNNPSFQHVQSVLDEYKRKLKFTCFTSNDETNILMRSHYANSSKGFCCKYEVENINNCVGNPIMQMIYTKKPCIPTINDFKKIQKIINDNSQKSFVKEQNINLELEYLKTLACNKAHCWRNEKEYRITYLSSTDDIGESIPLKGLKLVAIYVGYNCKKEYRDQLKDFCLKSNPKIEYHEMNKKEDEFKLYSK